MENNGLLSPVLGNALLCEAGQQRIAIPVQLAGQVVEYEVLPLPLARPGVRGMALYEGRVLLSLGIGAELTRRHRRPARGVLLSLPDVEGSYALEVDRLGTLGQMRRGLEGAARKDAWWVHAIDERSRPHLWFDVSAFVQALLAPVRRAP